MHTKTVDVEALYGRRASHETLKTWLTDPKGLLIVHGPTGAGKTASIHAFADHLDIETVETDNIADTLERSRHPSFLGHRRVALFDGVSFSKRDWKTLTTSLKNHGPPSIVATHDLNSVPYNVRRSATLHAVHRPEPRFLLQYLKDYNLRLGLDVSDSLLHRISESADSWRAALIQLVSTPSVDLLGDQVREPILPEAKQPQAVLSGTYRKSSCHALSILNMAEWNGADADSVQVAHLVHSRSWETNDLSRVARMLLDNLRSPTQDSPPFRRRAIKGGIRRF